MIIMSSRNVFCFIFVNILSVSQSIDLKSNKLLYTNIVNGAISKLEYLGAEIENYIGVIGDVSHIVRNVTEVYNTELEKLFKTMAKHKITHELERQFYYLYIVEACNEIFTSHSKLLLDSLTSETDNYEVDTDKFLEMAKIKKLFVDEKKSNLMYICINLEVCRSFPGFSNSLADFLDGILSLPSSKFIDVIKLLKEILEVKLAFQRSIMNEGIAFQLSHKLTKIIGKPKDMRKLFTVIREVMTKKYKLFKTHNGTLKIRTKVARLLIDITDKAFESVGEEAIFIEFDNLIKSLKLWAIGERTDIKNILEESCNFFFDTLQFYWDPDTKKEVKLLIEVYMTGTTSESSLLYDDLILKGSNFLKNDNLLSNADLMI